MITKDSGHDIRVAGILDATLLSQLGARTFREAFGLFIPHIYLDSYISTTYNPARQMAELTDPARKCLIVEREGTAVGYALLHTHEALAEVEVENPVELERLYLLQDFSGHGLGSLLMNECIKESRRSSHKGMWLQVWERNERAIVFYRKLGFETVGFRSKLVGKLTGRDLIMTRAI
jgi:GNAT superfamily N-acetyltransferase